MFRLDEKKLIKAGFLDVVNCGSRQATTCADCPQGGRKCKGDCKFVKLCQSKDPSKGL